MANPFEERDCPTLIVRLCFKLGVKAALLGSELVVSQSVADCAVGWDFLVFSYTAALCDAELDAKFLAVMVWSLMIGVRRPCEFTK